MTPAEIDRPAPVPHPDEYRAAARFWHDACMEQAAELDRLRKVEAAARAVADCYGPEDGFCCSADVNRVMSALARELADPKEGTP